MFVVPQIHESYYIYVVLLQVMNGSSNFMLDTNLAFFFSL